MVNPSAPLAATNSVKEIVQVSPAHSRHTMAPYMEFRVLDWSSRTCSHSFERGRIQCSIEPFSPPGAEMLTHVPPRGAAMR